MVAAALLGVGVSRAPQAKAANFFWDVGGVATGLGGVGSWNSSNVSWVNAGDAVSAFGMSPTSAALLTSADVAYFYGTAGAVTLGESVTVGGLNFGANSYSINTGANTLSFANQGTSPSTITLNNLANANATSAVGATITGSVGGSGNLTVSGGLAAGLVANTLTLNGTSAGGWTGATTIGISQTIALSGLNQGLLNTSAINLNGGGITLTNTTTAGESALNRVSDSAVITANGGTITFTNTASASVNYAETLGSVALASGLLTVTSTNNNTSPSTQTLTLSGLSRTGTNPVAQINFTGASLGAAAQNVIAITGQGATTASIAPWMIYGGTDFAAYNASSGVRAASGTTALSASVVGSSATDYTAASVSLGAGGSMRTLKYSGSTALTVTAAATGTTSIGGVVSTGANHVLAGASPYQALASGEPVYFFINANQLTVSAPIASNGSTANAIVLGGAGTLSLTGTNTFAGNIVLNSGILSYTGNVPATLGDATNAIVVNGSSTLTAITTGGTNARNITLNNGALLSFTNAAIGQTYSGNITGTGGILVNNTSGTLTTFSGTNTFTGPIQITSGTLTAAAATNLGNALNPVHFANTAGVTLNLSGAVTYTLGSISGAGTSGGTITLGAAGTTLSVGGNNESTTYAGTITGSGAFTKTGTGILTLSGTNTFTGAANLNGGLVSISVVPNLGNGSAISINGGGVQFTPNTGTSSSDISSRTVTIGASGATFDTSAAVVQFASPVGNSGAGALTKSGNGTLILRGANTFTGAVNVSHGNLVLMNAQGMGTGASGVTVGDGGTISLLGGISIASRPLTLSGAGFRSSGGALVGLGGGTNVYAGALTLGAASAVSADAGILNLTNASAVTGSGFTLTLAGSGTGTLSAALGTGTGGLTKTGAGTWNLIGAGGTNTGALTVNAGTLNLTGGAIGTPSSTILGGGTLAVSGTQDLGPVSVSSGAVAGITANSAASVTLGAITRSAGGTLAFNTAGGGVLLTSATGLLGFATLTDAAGTGAAYQDGTNIVRLSSFSGGVLADDTNNAANDYTTAGMASNPLLWSNGLTTRSVNSLTIDTASGSQVVDMGAVGNLLTLTSGLLQMVGSNDATLRGGRIGESGSDLIVQQHGTGMLTLGSAIGGGSGGLIKLGSGAVVLTGGITRTTGTLVAGSASVTVPSTVGLAVGQAVTGGDVPAGTTIANITDGTTLVLSNSAVSNATNTALTFGSGSNFSGDTRILAGTLRAGASSIQSPGSFLNMVAGYGSSVGGALSPFSTVTLANASGTALDVNGLSVVIGGLQGGGASGGNVQLGNGGVLTVGGPNLYQNLSKPGQFMEYAGSITGAGSLSLTGGGVLALTGSSNTYSGQTNVLTGTLVVNASSLPTATSGIYVGGVDSGSLTVGGRPGGTLIVQGGLAASGLTVDRNITFSGRGNNVVGSSFLSIGNNTFTGYLSASPAEARIGSLA